MNDDKLREILAEELEKAGVIRNAQAVRDNSGAGGDAPCSGHPCNPHRIASPA